MNLGSKPSERTEANARVSEHYNETFWSWQRRIGDFGGWANLHKFESVVDETDCVIDFGCGGGYLLSHLKCAERIGIEPNNAAAQQLQALGIHRFRTCNDLIGALGHSFADVVISNHALEHVLNPLQELRELRSVLKPGGLAVFYVPCETYRLAFNQNDQNRHLFSWSPQNLGNLFLEAGYEVEFVKPYFHKWPPGYLKLAKLGERVFHATCRIWGHIDRSWTQVEIRATNPLHESD